jgi:hypothetical protein
VCGVWRGGRYHLVQWLAVCQPRDQGALDVTNLDTRIFPRDPTNVIFFLCRMLDSWSILQKSGVQKLLQLVAERLTQVAREIYGCRVANTAGLRSASSVKKIGIYFPETAW